jgi:hypothetical protein
MVSTLQTMAATPMGMPMIGPTPAANPSTGATNAG